MFLLKNIFLIVLLAASAFDVLAQSEETKLKENINVDDEDTIGSVTEVPIEDDVEFDEHGVPKLKPSSDIDTHFLFTKPDNLVLELPSGKEVQFLVGFKNNGKQDYLIQAIHASFRYPQDYSYVIQNYSALTYNKLVKPDQEATLAYTFKVTDDFSDRSLGFTVNLFYKNLNGKLFANAVFNQTIGIIELDEGLTFDILFVYLVLVSLVGLIIFAIYHYFLARGFFGKIKKRVEVGTQESFNIDYEWIPTQNLNSKTSPKVTPKLKKAKKVD